MPTGGQFANMLHAESNVALDEPTGESIVDKESSFTKKYDTVDEKLKAIGEELAAAVADLRFDDEWNKMLDVMSRFHHYSLSNQMLIAIQTGGRATRAAGFRKWQELGRQVKKGEKGITILAPKRVSKTEKDENGKPVIGADGKPVRRSFITGFTTATVFDISQTEGDEIPDVDKMMELSEEPPSDFKKDLTDAIHREGFTVEYAAISGGTRGYTDPIDKKVVIRADLPPANQTSTLAHELGHIRMGHLDRMDEYRTGHSGKRPAMEIEAESFAYALCRINGQDPVGKSGRYVASWGDTNPEKVKESAEAVANAVKETLAADPWKNAAERTPA